MQENVLKWIGGKHTLGEWLIKRMPPHSTYVEVFMGGGNIFLQKPLAKVNVVNDLNGNLVNMYKVINHEVKKELLKHKFDNVLYDRNMFEFFLELYKTNNISYLMKNDVERAFIYIYLNRTSFNGMMQSYARRDDPTVLYTLDSIIEKMYKKFQAGRTVIEKLPFEELLAEMNWGNNPPTVTQLKYDRQDVFIYLDPPYWVTTEAQGASYYEKVMKQSEHTLLKDIMIKHKRAKFMISYDDHPAVRMLYKLPREGENVLSDYEGIRAVLTPETHQSSGSLTEGDAIFKRELVITNYDTTITGTMFE